MVSFNGSFLLEGIFQEANFYSLGKVPFCQRKTPFDMLMIKSAALA